MAFMHVSIFGIMPPESVPLFDISWASFNDRCSIIFCSLLRTPSTSVRSISLLASTAEAIAPAAVSALILNVSSLSPIPIGAMTGIISVDSKAHMNNYLRTSKIFAVNILTVEHEELSVRFAQHGPKDFSDIEYRTEITGAPIFEKALAYVDCQITSILPGGDHDIFIGEILAGGQQEGKPLIYYGGKYRRLPD